MALQDRCLTIQGTLWPYKIGVSNPGNTMATRQVSYNPVRPYKTDVLQCRDHCGVIRLVVYEYMGLIIRERVKLTFFGLGFVHFFVLPCVSFNFDLLVKVSAESKNLSSRQIVKIASCKLCVREISAECELIL